ncbi:Chromosomal replication initiator protein DnaA [Candidatus Vampirococcus lugosii]|uniref:Chromosomal replication initiator protein DnaA n=1 Tax=Candidatus Vampirococcus lugosii TaxID=2789015 RepID=A0ABS5QN95_9BACT|nr:DnaA/Hda family protein [Candidatus Vampirococcus lugosii]MBS8122183.1 Chromosomal replication initiator protein DnaA [Candidatus Vampirococcus lugosii]
MPTSKLIDEIVENIRKNTINNLTKKLDEVDVLILDDIQFLAGKDKTQEIFHNIFNDFYSKKKQIVLSSDRPPKELDLLEARLRSRFGIGLVTDIKKPDFETRMAIINSKLREKSEYLEYEYIEIIAKYVKDNVREIEGAVNIMLTRKNLLGQDLTEKDIYDGLEILGYNVGKESLQDAKIKDADTMNNKSYKSFAKILEYIANYYSISISDIKGNSRKKEVSVARQMLMYIAKKHYGWTLEKIGTYFGGKNHATVIYAIKNFEKLLKSNTTIYNDYHIIIQDLV